MRIIKEDMYSIQKEYERVATVYENRPWAEFWRCNEIPVVTRNMKNHVQRGDMILDAGCATGMYLPHIQNMGARYYGLDICKSMVKLAKAKLPSSEASNIIMASIEQLPFKTGTFDAVLLSKVLSHYKDASGILHEVFRVLKPGKYLFLCDIHKAHNKPFAILKTYDGREVGRVRNYLREPCADAKILDVIGGRILKCISISLENAKWKPPKSGPLGNLWFSSDAPILYMICAQKLDGGS